MITRNRFKPTPEHFERRIVPKTGRFTNVTTQQQIDLVADIGATRARFQLVLEGALQGAPLVLGSTEFDDAQALIRAALEGLEVAGVRQALFALAGPRDETGAIRLTNTGMRFAPDACAGACDGPCELVNDFFALAHGVPYFDQLVQIGGDAGASGNKAILGPGSGLGMAMLLATGQGSNWQVVASEGGNADLAIGSHLEAELWAALVREHDHVSWETVLSGPGTGQSVSRHELGMGYAGRRSAGGADIGARRGYV